MSDDIDRANDQAEYRRQVALANVHNVNREGPKACNRCGDRDERIKAGYAVCQSCRDDMRGEAS